MIGKYQLTVGLEIHAELNTRTKMFCDSRNNPDETHPNTNVCPVCMGYPGTLPVINKEAVKHVLRLGLAVDGQLADYTEFDRKNYFYPDIPKGYQLSQYKYPLVRGGQLAGVDLTRIHLEEDTARSTHDKGDDSLVDFNRAGLPLMELVTEPVIHDAETAVRFAKELQLLLMYLGVAHANMEKGEMRVEANISVGSGGKLGTKVEVKNLNSFKAVEKAITHEYTRHVKVLEEGGSITQETRGWDEKRGETFSQRAKEDSHDYRYFPDPDLPKLFISEVPEFDRETLRKTLGELPWEKRERYMREFNLKESDIEIYLNSPEWGVLLEDTVSILNDYSLAQLVSNYITSDLKEIINPTQLASTILMLFHGEISSRGAKEILKIIQNEGGEARRVAETHNLLQQSDTEELKKIVQEIISTHTQAVEEYKNGKLNSLQFLVGQGMRATKGSGNPQILRTLFEEFLR